MWLVFLTASHFAHTGAAIVVETNYKIDPGHIWTAINTNDRSIFEKINKVDKVSKDGLLFSKVNP